jgi:hypothetical protein
VSCLLPEDKLVDELKGLNTYLENRCRVGGTNRERRRRAEQKGIFTPLCRLSAKEISSFFQGRPLVGVDGSLVTYGASYPYLLTFFRALAYATSAEGGHKRIWEQEIFSPLLPRYQQMIDEHLTGKQTPEEIVAHLRWGILAQIESKVAVQALSLKPRLLLMDGGFNRLKEHAPDIWNELKAAAIREGVLLLGVTEEIASCSLMKILGFDGDPVCPGVMGDREILFGMLQPGEMYRLQERTKGEKGRLYVRFAGHPQVVAVDYLMDQEREVEPALNFLYSITPAHGRGIPLWLDVVDAEVRLSREQVEAMIAACLDPAMVEVFLRPLRANREL